MRTNLDHMPGRTIRRKVWSLAALSGNANERSGCATALPLGYGPWGDAAQEVIQLAADAGNAIAVPTTKMHAAKAALQRRARFRLSVTGFIVDLLRVGMRT